MRPSMKDIAEATGVSRPTVSLILSGSSGKYRIAEATQRKVLEAAKRLGFRRNELAASVKRGKSKTIAFIGGVRASYVLEIIAGVNEAAMKANYTLKLFDLNAGNDIKKVAGLCLSQMVDGVICRSLSENELEVLRQEFEPHSVPVILVDSSFPHDWCTRVISDDVSGGALAVKHLTSLGCQRIGLVNVDDVKGFATLRREGYLKGLEAAGLKADPSLEIKVSGKHEWGECEWKPLLKYLEENRPDAVFCVSDPLAARTLSAAFKLGLGVPADLKLVGYGNIDLAIFATTSLSSIAQPFFKMGSRVAEELFGAIAGTGDFASRTLMLPVTLIKRDSTKRNPGK